MDYPFHSPSLGAQEENAEAPPYDFAYGTTDRKVFERRNNTQGFTYKGAQPVPFASGPKNIILFGETGVGKSSVVNLMAGAEVADTSSRLEGCTLDATEYSFTLPGGRAFRIFDTVGLEEPEMGVNTFLGAIEKAHKLISALHKAGGVDLLLFCIRAGRVTLAMQRTYHLFFHVLCGGEVPLAIVVTNLEREDVMEKWWIENETELQQSGIHSVAHACITAIPARVMMYAQKRAESQEALRVMLRDALGNLSPSYSQEKKRWFVAVVAPLRSFVTKNSKALRKRELSKKLVEECRFSRNDAQRLAEVLAGKNN